MAYSRFITVLLKMFQTVLSLTVMYLLLNYPISDLSWIDYQVYNTTINFTLYGWTVLNLFLIGGLLFKDPGSKWMILLFGICGTLVHLATTVFLFMVYIDDNKREHWNTSATEHLYAFVASIVNTIIHGADSVHFMCSAVPSGYNTL